MLRTPKPKQLDSEPHNGKENAAWLWTCKHYHLRLRELEPDDPLRKQYLETLDEWSIDSRTPPDVKMAARGLYHAI